MKATVKITGAMLDSVRADLSRRHAFAWERVGFLTAAATATPDGLLLTVRDYLPVADGDYERDPRVGAKIGSAAMRKAIQAAYRPQLALLHIHTHGGYGTPGFSRTDLESAHEFVPGFFGPIPKMPHGLIVLSNNAASGLLWLRSDRDAVKISEFIRVGAPYQRVWGVP
jgi:hypothetical protein